MKTKTVRFIVFRVHFRCFFVGISWRHNHASNNIVSGLFAGYRQGRWLCTNNCGRSYKNKGDLMRHKKKECGIAPQYRCDTCNKMFKHVHHLKSHMIVIHHKLFNLAASNWNFIPTFHCCKYLTVIDVLYLPMEFSIYNSGHIELSV